MRKTMSIIVQLLLKVLIFIALAIVWLLHHLSMICCVTIRLIAVPLMLVSGVIAVTTYPDTGLSSDVIDCILVFISAMVFYFGLPYVAAFLNYAVVFLAELLKAPLSVSPTVKYTF